MSPLFPKSRPLILALTGASLLALSAGSLTAQQSDAPLIALPPAAEQTPGVIPVPRATAPVASPAAEVDEAPLIRLSPPAEETAGPAGDAEATANGLPAPAGEEPEADPSAFLVERDRSSATAAEAEFGPDAETGLGPAENAMRLYQIQRDAIETGLQRAGGQAIAGEITQSVQSDLCRLGIIDPDLQTPEL